MTRLEAGWEAAATDPGACEVSGLDGLDWLPARVPGTAAAVLSDAGRSWGDLDAQDWWFRTTLAPAPGDDLVLRFDGIATVADVFLDGRLILESGSMFERHLVDIGDRLLSGGELVIRCRALAPLLARRRLPRARWRSRLAANDLRWFRTMLLGRAPGIAPEPAAVGPWRPVVLARRGPAVRVRTRVEGDDGVVVVHCDPPTELTVEIAGAAAPLAAGGGEVRVPRAARWWPHTHGDPALHGLRLLSPDGRVLDERRVGFRELTWAPDVDEGGLDLRVNGVPVFARGAVWTPVDPVSLAPADAELRATLESARDAGMNMVRVPGTSCYESDAFYDLCDELGVLVWQDFMFANFDYPAGDPEFRATVEREARQTLAALSGRPSLAVLCGSSEVEQQAAMLGLAPALGRGELFGELLPTWAREAEAAVPYVPSAPCGGELPFRTDRGVANYYGVGGYRRPFADARLADVRFAAECLAFANVPDGDPVGKAGVPRDAGAEWDFEDVRDHYLQLLYDVEPSALDRERYLELSRATSGEAMAEVLGEWRREESPCRGALVLWLRDLGAGSGWGLLDSAGRAKVAYSHLRRVLAPVALWLTDEGLNGVDVHVANDRPEPLRATLRVALYRGGELRIDEAREEIEVPAHGSLNRGVEAVLGRFVDVNWVYRFGPPAHDAIVASLERGEELLSQAFRFPLGFPLAREELGLEAELDGSAVRLRTRRLAYGVRVDVPGCTPVDDAFSLEPGRERVVELRGRPAGGSVSALNLAGRIELR